MFFNFDMATTPGEEKLWIQPFNLRLKIDLVLVRMVGLFGFYGISAFVGYLMPNPFLYK